MSSYHPVVSHFSFISYPILPEFSPNYQSVICQLQRISHPILLPFFVASFFTHSSSIYNYRIFPQFFVSSRPISAGFLFGPRRILPEFGLVLILWGGAGPPTIRGVRLSTVAPACVRAVAAPESYIVPMSPLYEKPFFIF